VLTKKVRGGTILLSIQTLPGGYKLKKLMLLAAMLALVVVAASPAFAQDSEIEVEEGDVTLTDTSTTEGSIVQNCPASVTFGDENENVQAVETGQQANINIDGDENELEIEQALEQAGFSPEVATECTQEIAQAAAAGAGKAEAKAGGAEAKAGEAKAGGAEAKAGEAPKAEAKAGGGAEAKAGGAEAKAELPKTGGGASLLALGAGALLVGGGLVARRIIK
jgi:LPXTG-motif cell wall-anchored protein